MIFDASLPVLDNNKETKERCKRNLTILCHVSIFEKVKIYFIGV